MKAGAISFCKKQKNTVNISLEISKKMQSLINKTVVKITGLEIESEDMRLEFSDGTILRHYHSKDCCETVRIADITGNKEDLIGQPLLMAEIVSNNVIDAFDSETWTFIKFATVNGYVTIRWLGESNGYYGEIPAQEILEN